MLNNEQIKELNELTTRLAELAKETYSPDFNGKTERGDNIYNLNITVSVQRDEPVLKEWTVGCSDSSVNVRGESFANKDGWCDFRVKVNNENYNTPKTVTVTVKEVLQRDVEVEVPADVEDKEDYAKEKVREMYRSTDIVLDENDFDGNPQIKAMGSNYESIW